MKLYLVGGTVRRHMLNLPASKDFDFAVEAPSFGEMVAGLLDRGVTVFLSRPEFVTVRGHMPVTRTSFSGLLRTSDRVVADFTLCRAETMYSDRRHPDTVTPTTLDQDLSRRDFTVNAVAVAEDGEWIDQHGGVNDAFTRTLRCVGRARQRMMEDPLRMLRAVRFAVTDGLYMDADLKEALRDHYLADHLTTLPVERIREELHTALRHDWRNTMIHLLCDAPILGDTLSRYYPNLWLKPTTEER